MWSNRVIVGFGHASDQPQLGDAARIVHVRLQDLRCALLQDLAESPLGEDALAGRQRNVRLLRQVRHHVDVQRLHDFFVEPRLIRLQRFDQQASRSRLDRSVKIDGNVHAVAILVAQCFEVLGNSFHIPLALDVLGRLAAVQSARTGLHRIDASLFANRAVYANAVAHGPAQKFVNRHAKGLAFDVPQRLVDAAHDRRLDRTAAIERPAVDRLPMENHFERILPDQIVADFQRAGRARLGVVFEHFAPTGNAGVGRNFHEDPSILEHEGLDLGDLNVVLRADLSSIRALSRKHGVEAKKRTRANHRRQQRAAIHTRHNFPPFVGV